MCIFGSARLYVLLQKLHWPNKPNGLAKPFAKHTFRYHEKPAKRKKITQENTQKDKKNCFFYRAVLHIVCSVQIFPACFWLAGPACNWFLVLRFDAISLRLRRNFRMAALLLIAVHWFGFKCNRDDIIALAPSLKIFVQNTDANTLYQWPTLYSKENNFQCRAYVFLGKFCGFALSTFSGSKKTAQEIERKCIELYRWLEQIRTHTHTHTLLNVRAAKLKHRNTSTHTNNLMHRSSQQQIRWKKAYHAESNRRKNSLSAFPNFGCISRKYSVDRTKPNFVQSFSWPTKTSYVFVMLELLFSPFLIHSLQF